MDAQPAARLLDTLRVDLGLTGVKMSCEIGRCGACLVLVDGKPMNACLTMLYQCEGTAITTIEGLTGKDGDLDPLQSAFLQEGALQCGYCTPGMVLAVKALLEEHPQPTREQIREGLAGNLCRCTGYGGIIRAVERAARERLAAQQAQTEGRRNAAYSLTALNEMSLEEWSDVLGGIFEHSPWVAEVAASQRPFASVPQLHKAMCAIVRNSPEERRLELLRAHPDLASRIRMTDVSASEQQGAGLDRLSPEEFAFFARYNKQYTNRFGFPFIMAVREQTKESILASMIERVGLSVPEEFSRAVAEVEKIASFRLQNLIAE
jgi:carbon-monoxide dehydrogenase small subunit